MILLVHCCPRSLDEIILSEDVTSDMLPQLLVEIRGHRAIQEASGVARTWAEKAKIAIQNISNLETKDILISMCDATINRQN